jgi:ATP dependent DNA ligase-like protein
VVSPRFVRGSRGDVIRLPASSAVLDGELVYVGADGQARFYALMREMHSRSPEESALMFFCFDLLHENGVDLRGLPLSERRRDLERLCRKARVPFMKMAEQFPDCQILFQYACDYGFEGIVSKKLASRYSSGPSNSWRKAKCPQWKRDNAERYRIFEKPSAPAPSERTLQRRKTELARVRESLARPGLRVGMKDALRAQVRVLVEEIAALEAELVPGITSR